ncbi:AlpA family phage regulatory protein [Chromobacterium phragmitis]|nr:AlpA family phage regulatory protein [Chromobacterium amazonense]MBM2884867.1 AlpA family phage regulatory protein [Chromobacterium amazonense]MDE1714789.1 AlpA family phage regulatory protein [Chromobacterium amazonense]
MEEKKKTRNRKKLDLQPLYLDLEDAAAVVALSPAVVQQLVRKEAFPKPREISTRRVGWLYRELVEWSETRPASTLLPPPSTGNRSGSQSLSER